jgi:hypothetical protein
VYSASIKLWGVKHVEDKSIHGLRHYYTIATK